MTINTFKETNKRTLTELFKFSIIGLSNIGISYLVTLISLFIFHHFNLFCNYDYLIANILAFIISVGWAFFWNNHYVFHSFENRKSLLGMLLQSYLSYAFTGIVLNSILLYIWIDVLGISKFIAPLLNPVISMPVNFLLNKYWIFCSHKQKSTHE